MAWDTQRDGLDQKKKVYSWLLGEFSLKGLGQRSKKDLGVCWAKTSELLFFSPQNVGPDGFFVGESV